MINNKYAVFIHSYKRPKSVEKLVKKYPVLKKSILVIRQDDGSEYDLELFNDNIVMFVDNLADKRQLILEFCIQQGIEKAILLDDDITFDKRRTDDIKKSYKCTDSDVEELIVKMFNICSSKYPLVHPLSRLRFDEIKQTYSKNRPAIRAVCVHIPTLVKEKINYNGLNSFVMSDRFVQLSLLEKGYTTIALGQYMVDDGGTNKKGGCAEYRSVEMQSEAAKKLKKCFPDIIKLKYKQDGNWSEKRIDCIMYLSKYTNKDELRYVPKQEMEEWLNERNN